MQPIERAGIAVVEEDHGWAAGGRGQGELAQAGDERPHGLAPARQEMERLLLIEARRDIVVGPRAVRVDLLGHEARGR